MNEDAMREAALVGLAKGQIDTRLFRYAATSEEERFR
jgi:hypothetical protein